MNNVWGKAYDKRPINKLCSEEVEICIVGKRCVYINEYRIQGGKPYASENLPQDRRTTTVRDVLGAFSPETIRAYLEEKIAVDAYFSGLRNYRDAE